MKIKCDHCHLEFDKKVMMEKEIDGEIKHFCCKGCEGVYILLKDEGFGSFYDKLGDKTLAPPKEGSLDYAKFDSEAYKERYIREKDELFETSLIIEGIHCSACVWLNEKVLNATDGVIDFSINYTNNKASITFDPKVIKLSDIVKKIEAIGYKSAPYDPTTQEREANSLRRDYYTRMVVGIFCTMNIMWIAVAQYAGYFTGMRSDIKTILNVAEWILATPALFFSGWVFFKGAYFGLKNRFVNMDLLVISGALLIYLYSIYATITMRGETYFESATMIVTFILIGKFLEVRAKKSAVDELDRLNSSIPTEVTIIKDGKREKIAPEAIKIGDIIEVKAGERVAVDGELLEDSAEFDESLITGESRAISKKGGGSLISGSINLSPIATFKATKELKDSTMNTLVSLIEDSLKKRPKIEEKTNIISGYFSISILAIAVATFFGWLSFGASFENSMVTSVAVIIIACPCALALATPVAALVGIGEALKKGVLFKEVRFIETLALSRVAIFDKTGTITEGKPSVINFDKRSEFDINMLYSLVSLSDHPISKGVKSYLEKSYKELQEIKIENFEYIRGRGLRAKIGNQELLGGNLEFIKESGMDADVSEQNSLFMFVVDKKIVAIFELKDAIKNGAKEAISEIKKAGYAVVMLSGDNKNVALEIAKSVGIEEVYAQKDPYEKASIVEEIKSKRGGVIMIGDGINDALSFAKSDISIAMGKGVDLAVRVSDVVILNDSIESLKSAILIAKKSYSFIKQNLAISLIYNLITIPLAVAGFIIPLIAAISMSISSLIVVGNSMRIKS